MSYRNIFKILIPSAVLFVGQAANAQIIIGPVNPQEVPVYWSTFVIRSGWFHDVFSL